MTFFFTTPTEIFFSIILKNLTMIVIDGLVNNKVIDSEKCV